MKFWTRKGKAGGRVSQRASVTRRVTIEQNFAGQGGTASITLKTAAGDYMVFEPESDEEARAMMSAASIMFMNFRDKRRAA